MGVFRDAASVLISVFLRKSTRMFHEVAFLLLDLLSILTSAVQYSRLNFRQSPAVFTTYPPMAARHDR